MTCPRESIRQLQNTLGVSVYRWKFKALNDWHSKLESVLPLTNLVVEDIAQRLQLKYPIAEKGFALVEFSRLNNKQRWLLLLQRMGECEQLVHAIWEYIQQRLKQSKDNYLRHEIRITCYEAGLKELDRIKQTIVTKTRKKESLIKSLVKSKRWSLPGTQRKSLLLVRYKSEESLNSFNFHNYSHSTSRLSISMISEVRTLSPLSDHDETDSDYSDYQPTPRKMHFSKICSSILSEELHGDFEFKSAIVSLNGIPQSHTFNPGTSLKTTANGTTLERAWIPETIMEDDQKPDGICGGCCGLLRHQNKVHNVKNT